MEFRKVLALRGLNIWARFPVLEAWLEMGALNDTGPDAPPGWHARLKSWLPGPGERLQEGATLPGALAVVALELQELAGAEVAFAQVRAMAAGAVYQVVVEYREEELGRACLESARLLCLAAIHDQALDVAAEIERLRRLAEQAPRNAGTAAVLEAARRAGIPARQVTPEGLLFLGQGARQRRFLAGQTDQTSALAESIAGDRELTRSLLQAVGVPTPPDGQPAGAGRRLLVVGEQVVAASDVAASFQLADSSAPAQERPVARSESGDERNKTVSYKLAATIHPEVAARAVEAVRVIGLDVAEVGVVAESLDRPLEEQGGVIDGIDPHADLGRFGPAGAGAVLEYLFPGGQTGRIPVVAVTGVNGKTTTTRLITRMLGRSGRCVGMTSTEGIYLFERQPGADGWASRRLEVGDCSGPASAQAVLQHPRVEAAVLETARGSILRAGLGFDQCDVAVVTNIGEGDHLGMCDIDTPEQLARVKRTIVEAVAPGGAAVLKADDPLVAKMAGHCPGSVVFFSRDARHPVVLEHLHAGKRAVVVQKGWIVLAEGRREVPLVALEQVRFTWQGRVGFQVENALAAAAAGWALHLPLGMIIATLKTFSADVDQAPARFNLLEVNGAVAVFDYGHNADSLASLIAVLEQMPHRWRSVVYTAAGDRRDSDLVRQGELLGDGFDRVVLYEEEHCTRGRGPGEIISLFRQGLAGRRRVSQVEEVRGALPAIQALLESARPGDLLLVQVDLVEETVELMRRRLAGGSAREIDFTEALALARAGAVPFSEKRVLEEESEAIVTRS
jgi:cyanophycin synthetase